MSTLKRATLFDYGAGNLHSLAKALASAGLEVTTETDPLAALDTDLLILPGVGNFTVAAKRLAPAREQMRSAIAAGLPTLGVCLGMQLLFDDSTEGPGAGLGVFHGHVTRLNAEQTPQIGWNSIHSLHGEPLFTASSLSMAYYANSFACRPADPSVEIAWTTHELDRFPAAVRSGRTLGVQFHPEKSSRAGVKFLHQFVTDTVR